MTRARRLALVLPVTAVGALVLSFVPFFWPHTGDPIQADAVVVLSGDHGERLPLAMGLIERGVTSTLVLDGTPDSAQGIELCEGGQPFEVICVSPIPDNTREEARAAGRLVVARGWHRIVVATSTYHVPRSKLVFNRCVDGQVVMVGAEPPADRRFVLRNVVREWLGVIRAVTVARGC